MMLKKNRTKKGFTLIELLVLLGIIGVMTAITIAAISGKQRYEKKLEIEAEKLVAVIKEAQNYAITGKRFEDEIPCRFRLNFQDSTHYRIIMKKKINDDCDYDPPQFVYLDSNKLGNEILFSSTNDFHFRVPHAELWSGGSQVGSSVKAAVLQSPDGSSKLTICVYASGQTVIKEGDVGC